MNDLDFFQTLKTKEDKAQEWTDAAYTYMKLKKASAATEGLKRALPAIAGGAGAGALLTYLSARPNPSLGGKSDAEHDLADIIARQQSKGEQDMNLYGKLKNRTTELSHGIAKAFREHPGQAAATGAVTGGSLAYMIARRLGAK